MATPFQLTIAKVGENVFSGPAVSVTLPGAEGVFTVLARHEAFVSELKAGTINVTLPDGTKQTFPIERGVAEISNNQATVLL